MSEPVRSTIQKRDEKGVIRHGGEWLAIWSDPESVKTAAEKTADERWYEAVARYQTRIAASVRSVSGDTALQVRFGHDPGEADQLVLEPFRRDDLDLAAARGEADAAASLVRFHDSATHERYAPEDRVERRFFNHIEGARCRGRACRMFAGVHANLTAWQYQRLRRADLLNAHLASLLPLSEGLDMVLRDTFAGAPEPSIQTAGMRMWDQWLRVRYGGFLDRLGDSLSDQSRYAALSLELMGALFAELPSRGERISRYEDRPGADDERTSDDSFLRDTDILEDVTHLDPGEWLYENPPDALHQTVSQAKTVQPKPYRPFTTQHDRIVDASALDDRVALRKARLELDRKRGDDRQSFAKIVSRLQRRLMAQQARRWEFDQEEGLIDASKLDRVVLNPGFSHAYKMEAESRFRDTIVSLLIDNSGSMRGKPIEMAVLVSDLLAAALERCSIATEILGFTTSAWKGGESARDWAHAGRPPEPGRLNDLLHIVYKSADTSFRRSRDSLCAMLSPSVLKENIDGEALLWASQRLLQRREARKLLVVISDGAPVDQATLNENADKTLLDRHLRDAIKWVERSTPIELSAIGIKHDVGSYYSRAARIDEAGDLGATMVDMLDSLFAPD